MLSYRHSFHAGNHADVLKHLTQMLMLEKLNEKPKPYTYFDTHSGAALYSLDAEQSAKTAEFKTGIEKIAAANALPEFVGRYQQLVQPFWENKCYPGSPMIASKLMRETDVKVLCELHNTDIHILEQNMQGTGAKIHHRNGFEALVALMPPKPARGMVLIDPPYELAEEYAHVTRALEKALKRWQTGTFAIWYPLLSDRSEDKQHKCGVMIDKIAAMEAKSVLQVEFTVAENTFDAGMYGSGMIIVNPPWQLDKQLASCLPWLVKTLSDDNGSYAINWLKAE